MHFLGKIVFITGKVRKWNVLCNQERVRLKVADLVSKFKFQ